MNWMKSFVERILKNKVFWCCVLCVTALSFTAVCYANESGKEYSFWDLFFEGQMRQIFLENDITFESLITNPISIFMAMFMPILVIFPFLNVFWNEKNWCTKVYCGKYGGGCFVQWPACCAWAFFV